MSIIELFNPVMPVYCAAFSGFSDRYGLQVEK